MKSLEIFGACASRLSVVGAFIFGLVVFGYLALLSLRRDLDEDDAE